MLRLMKALWQDDAGALLAMEWMIVASLTVLGTVAGLASLAGGINGEANDMAQEIRTVRQSYRAGSSRGSSAAPAQADPTVRNTADNCPSCMELP
jgi:hypothetical protein